MSPRVFTIPPSLPFLPTLARQILSGRLVPGVRPQEDPLALAGLTVFVPTRRAARSLNGAFAEALGGGSAILPRVRILGEPDEAGASFVAAGVPTLQPVMEGLERRLHLARLVRFWKDEVAAASLKMLEGEGVVPPASAADALYLAADLCTLLDEIADEEIAPGSLARLAIEDRLAEWWQLTLTFLAILTEHWPAFLAERGMTGAAEARNLWARREAERYRTSGSADPVVIAGSTATAPATLALMRAVAELSNGAVVLPGLDMHLDETSFAAIDRALSIAAPGHPQHGLKRMLTGLAMPRDAVEEIGVEPSPPLAAREAFLSDALRPAETTDAWSGAERRHPDGALDGVALVEAADEREEALAIAVAMRDSLSRPDATVALTTPDRNLARRVVVELQRFGITANDSAGQPLAATPPGTLMILALDVALAPGDPVALLSLLKHPLTRLGFSPARARRAARTIEIIGLRGGTGRADVAAVAERYERRLAVFEADPRQASRAVRLISPEDRAEGLELARRLEAALQPLLALRGGAPAEIEDFAGTVTASLEALARDEADDPAELYAREAGSALGVFLAEIAAAPATGLAFLPAELPDAVRALAREITVRPKYTLSQRAFIWGALEARLQSVDTAILGGLNEGIWPQGARSDAFLSRLMRTEMLLDPPERRIGLAAHDFWMAMGAPKVVLTRSLRSSGAPAIASRWLQRIETLAGPEGTERMRAEGRAYLLHARGLDAAPEGQPIPRPAPCPPVEARPERYSVTEVERLIRDPYAVYARRVLRLEPLEDLLREPGAAERGNLYHRVLARFVTDGLDPVSPGADERLVAIAREEFAAEALPPEIEAVWWPRMETLCRNYLAWEREREPRVAKRHAEISGEWRFAELGTRLTGTADRIDLMRDGSIEILDFKTGTNPSVAQARSLLAPQLPLEGAMARLGAFESRGIARGASVSELLYVRLRERDFYEERLSFSGGRNGEPVTPDGLAEGALAKFRQLAAAYRDPSRGFQSRSRPFLAGDYSGEYDHLARALEWAAAGEEALETAEEGE